MGILPLLQHTLFLIIFNWSLTILLPYPHYLLLLGNKFDRRESFYSPTPTPTPQSRTTGPLTTSIDSYQSPFRCCVKHLQRARTLRDSMVYTPSKYIVLEIHHSGLGFDMIDVKRVNMEMFSFHPNELHGGGGSGGGTGSGLGMYPFF